MKLKSLLSTCLLAIIFFGLATQAYAHTLRADGTIQGTLHIDPADDPGANENSYVSLTFTDDQNKLDLDQCDCVLSISTGSTTLFSEKMNAITGVNLKKDSVAFSYIFPAKAVYTIGVTGNPLQVNAFQSFTLSYDIRVDRDSGGSISLFTRLLDTHFFHEDHLAHILIIGGGLIVGIVLTIQDRNKNKKYTEQMSENTKK